MTTPRPDEKDLVLETALAYIEAGLKCHPLEPPLPGVKDSGKYPPFKRWQKAELTAKQFRRLYRQGMNLGVRTGKESGLVCIDIDPRNGGSEWYLANDHRFGNHVREYTGGGGVHLYYRHPGEAVFVPTRRGKEGIAKGVEVLADGGAQVVTWPSTHWSGGAYHFENALTLLDVIGGEADELPQWVIEECLRKAKKVEAPAFDPNIIPVDLPENVLAAANLVNSRPPPVAGHGRNNDTYLLACRCRDFGLSKETAVKVLQEYYVSRTVGEPYGEGRLREVVGNAYRYAKSAFGSSTPQADFATPLPAEGEEPTVSEKEIAALEAEIDAAPRYKTSCPLLCADYFLSRHPEVIKYQEEVGYYYDRGENVWRFLPDVTLRSLVERDVAKEAPSVRKSLKMAKLKEITEAVKTRLQPERFRAKENTWLDGRGEEPAVRFENGILNPVTGVLSDHTPQWFSQGKLPFAFDASARCPGFEAFLHSIWEDDEDLKEALRLWVGFVLLGLLHEQKFAVFIGDSRAGKGVLTRLIQRLVGVEGYASITLSGLAGQFGLEQLLGKRLAILHDAYRPSGSLGDIATERLISVVGRDTQEVHRKYRPTVSCVLPLNVMLVCNDFPRFVNARGALSNRMLVFPFTKSFADNPDLSLDEKLAKEVPGIFNWAIEGAKRVVAGERLRQPKAALATFREIERQLNPVFAFLDEMLVVTVPEVREFWEEEESPSHPEDLRPVLCSELYEKYKRWCKDNNYLPLSREKFSSMVEQWSGKRARKDRTRHGGKRPWVFVNVRYADPEEPFEFH